MALNLWLRASLEHGRGGHIPNFGKFCWKISRESMDRGAGKKGKREQKPVFLLDDALMRDFGAKPWQKPLMHSVYTKVQEMNFTELAIRWSTILTKDLVFSGLRDLLSRLKHVIKMGSKCKVRFGCGKLLVKERKVAFVFDPTLHIRRGGKLTVDDEQSLPVGLTVAADSEIGALLNETSEGGGSSTRRTLGSMVPSTARSGPLSARLSSSASAPALRTARRKERQEQQVAAAEAAGVTSLDLSAAGITTARGGEDVESKLDGEAVPEGLNVSEEEEEGVPLSVPSSFRTQSESSNANITAFNADRSCVFAVSEKYRGGGAPDRLDRKAMREALKLAYDRHMIDIQAQIAGEEAQADHWRMQLWERELAYRAEMDKRTKDLASLDEFLRGQIVEQKQRLKNEDIDVRGVYRKGKAYPDFRRMKRLAKRYGVRRGSGGEILINTARSTSSLKTDASEDRVDADGVGIETARRQQREAVELGEALRLQIERRLEQTKEDRRHELEEGRRFVQQISDDSRRMLQMMEEERNSVHADLKEAWDRDTHVKNVLKLRRKMLKKGGFVFSSKPPTPSIATNSGTTKKKRKKRQKRGNAPTPRTGRKKSGPLVKVNLTGTTTAMLPEVEKKDHSVGYDMRTAR